MERRSPGQFGHLASSRCAPQILEMWPTRRPPIVEREDVVAIFGVLFDIRGELEDIRHLLEDDGEEEEETKPEL
jgi:hypothetical protein